MKPAAAYSFEPPRNNVKPGQAAVPKPKKAAQPAGEQAEMFIIPGSDAPQTKPGRAFSGIAQYRPEAGAAVYLASAPKNSTHFPILDVDSMMAYATERAESMRKLMVAQFGVNELVILPAGGGEWMSLLRTIIQQAVADGYAALEGGVPVAIPVDATAVPEEVLNAPASK